MKDEHIQKLIDDTKKNIIQGKENAKKIEDKLKDISDYLESFFGPMNEEREKAFEEYIKELKKK